VDNFFLEFNISFNPREANHREYSLALAASTFKPSIFPNFKYEVEVRHRKNILDNFNHWQVFSDYLELKIFLQTIEEFSNISIDQENEGYETKNQ
jgi:hypothetical protein